MTVTDLNPNLHEGMPAVSTVTAKMACVDCNHPLEMGAVDELAPRFSHRAHLTCGGCGCTYALTVTLRPTEQEQP